MSGPTVPWNAGWTGEERFEVRQCRYAEGYPALWQPHQPSVGRPIFAKPHAVRQRKSIAELRCTVCGERTPEGDRWWFRLGTVTDGMWMTTEAPVHRQCADHASAVCPRLRGLGVEPEPLPSGWRVTASLIAGEAVQRDFGITVRPGQQVIGALKLAWTLERARALGLVRHMLDVAA